ncbi:MAG: response regulator transcription factor [Lachnospiraceae bacterium]|nr:response regulator transcription factor [Lachnospiraceae bacterium]
MRIFVVEDEELIRRELKVLLENASYQVVLAESFEKVPEQVYAFQPDLVLLDVNLPGVSGFDICTRIREKQDVPIIFLTSRTDSMDELTGILRGGDDYITKPYQAPLLLARIAAVLKRSGGSRELERTRFLYHGVELDLSKCCIAYEGRREDLSKNEMKILHLLFLHPGEFVDRMDFIEYLWENQIFIDDNTLSVNVARIREKLKFIGVDDFIETKRGMGYRI